MSGRFIERHDSEIAGIWFAQGKAVISFSLAYIHLSEDEPGYEPLKTLCRRAELTIKGANETDLPTEWPCIIYEGELGVNGVNHPNEIPVPFNVEGNIELKLGVFNDAESKIIIITGSSAQLTLLGESSEYETWLDRG